MQSTRLRKALERLGTVEKIKQGADFILWKFEKGEKVVEWKELMGNQIHNNPHAYLKADKLNFDSNINGYYGFFPKKIIDLVKWVQD